jgi:hypothetical protein
MEKTMRTFASVITLLALAAVLGAQSTTFVVASADNTLFESAQGDLSGGGDDHIFVGETQAGGAPTSRRSILFFDVASAIPAGATIVSAELDLLVDSPNGAPGDTLISVHRVNGDWGEGVVVGGSGGGGGGLAAPGDVTWLHRFFPSLPWNSPGGDFGPAASSVTANGNGPITILSTPPLVIDVQDWLDDPCHNHGWLLDGNGDPAKRLGSRENSNPAARPRLVVQWTPGSVAPKYSGNGADLDIDVLVNGCADGNGDRVHPVVLSLADVVTLNFSSPGGTYSGQGFLAAVQPFPIGGTPGDSGGAPFTFLGGGGAVPIDLSPMSAAPIVLVDSINNPALFPRVLSPFPDFNVLVPPSFLGSSLVINLLVFDALGFPADLLGFAAARELVIN